jgi:hypothetical protein
MLSSNSKAFPFSSRAAAIGAGFAKIEVLAAGLAVSSRGIGGTSRFVR